MEMDSPFALLVSFYRRIDLPIDGLSVDSRQKIREFAVREFNFFLWLALIFVTVFLLKKLVAMFDLRRKGNSIQISSPSFCGHCKLLAWDNQSPREDFTVKHY